MPPIYLVKLPRNNVRIKKALRPDFKTITDNRTGAILSLVSRRPKNKSVLRPISQSMDYNPDMYNLRKS